MPFVPFAPANALPEQATNLQLFHLPTSEVRHGQQSCPALSRSVGIATTMVSYDETAGVHCQGSGPEWQAARTIANLRHEHQAANDTAAALWAGDTAQLVSTLADLLRREGTQLTEAEHYVLNAAQQVLEEEVTNSDQARLGREK